MASVYGNTTNHWRAYCDYTVTTNSDGTYAIRIDAAGFQSVGWGFNMSGVSTSVAATGQTTQSGSGSVYSGTGATVKNAQVTNKTFSWKKGTSAATKTVTVTVTNTSGYMNGTSSLSFNVSVSAATRHSVTFNANDGSGAPGTQYKYYGYILTLSTTKPTRSGYTFRGWGTSASATSASYQPGQQYGDDKDLALYAVWTLDHQLPSIPGLAAIRCDASGTASEEGNRAKVSFSWETFESATVTSIKVATRQAGTSSWTEQSVAASGTRGNVSVVLGATIDQGYSYDVRVVVTDSQSSSTTATTFVSQSYYLMDFHAGGDGMAIGKASTGAGFEVAMDSTFSETTTFSGDVPNMAKVYPVGAINAGEAYDASKHQLVILSGTIVFSGSNGTVSYGRTLAGTSSVVVSGGDDVGANNAVLVADNYTATGFIVRNLSGTTQAWRANWIAVGWVEI